MTTYEQSIDPMIEATVDLLHKYLRGDPMPVGENIVVPGRLIVRKSARQPVNARH
jgi:DNA-binding LacI/PurR family transcriptional regulator